MRRTLAPRLLQLALLAALSPLACHAAEPTPVETSTARIKEADARALLDKAVAAYRKNARAAIQAFNKPHGAFKNGEYYVYAVKLNGDFLANAADPHALVGMNTSGLRDASGKPFMKELLDGAKATGKGSVGYVWLNRADNKLENKTALYRKVGDTVLAVGYYTPRQTEEAAEALLNKAAFVLDSEGVTKASLKFNDPKGGFINDDLYVYVVGVKDGKFYANGASPSLVGLDGRDLRDAAGTPLIQEMLEKSKDSGSGVEDYVWRNPVTNRIEPKHALFRKVGDYLVAVGYYSN